MLEAQRKRTMKTPIVCPNKKDPAWKKLVEAIGEAPAYISFFRNANQIPDPAKARMLLGMKAAAPLTPKQSHSKSKKSKAPVSKATIESRPLILPKITADNFTKPFGRQRSKVLTEA
jgi:hypothetical protein